MSDAGRTPGRLRAVKDGEPPPRKKSPPRKKMSLLEAAESGSHRDLLVAMRERIAVALMNPNCPPRDLAALTRRLQDIAKEVDALDAQTAAEAKTQGADVVDGAFDASAV